MNIFKLLDLWAIGIGTQELLILVFVVVLLFGSTQIPKLMRGLGQGMGEFQKGLKDGQRKEDQ